MPTSKGSGKVFVKGVITEVFDSENEIRIIDFGVGRGTYSNLLKPAFPQSHWTGVEAYKPYVEKYNLEKKYSELIIGDMLDLDFAQQSFDIAFAGDVLEHCTKTEAIEFINRLCPVARLIVVSLPLGYRPQGVVEQKGHSIIPLKFYWKKGRVKVLLGVGRGKGKFDKRESIRNRDADRELRRATMHSMKGK